MIALARALSIRQPWAWLILHAGKDVENRTWKTHLRGTVLIHAGATMSRADYDAALLFVRSISDRICFDPGLGFPSFEELKAQTGGIVGSVEITGCVSRSDSPWFTGDVGFLLANPTPMAFEPYKGSLGFFIVK